MANTKNILSAYQKAPARMQSRYEDADQLDQAEFKALCKANAKLATNPLDIEKLCRAGYLLQKPYYFEGTASAQYISQLQKWVESYTKYPCYAQFGMSHADIIRIEQRGFAYATKQLAKLGLNMEQALTALILCFSKSSYNAISLYVAKAHQDGVFKEYFEINEDTKLPELVSALISAFKIHDPSGVTLRGFIESAQSQWENSTESDLLVKIVFEQKFSGEVIVMYPRQYTQGYGCSVLGVGCSVAEIRDWLHNKENKVFEGVELSEQFKRITGLDIDKGAVYSQAAGVKAKCIAKLVFAYFNTKAATPQDLGQECDFIDLTVNGWFDLGKYFHSLHTKFAISAEIYKAEWLLWHYRIGRKSIEVREFIMHLLACFSAVDTMTHWTLVSPWNGEDCNAQAMYEAYREILEKNGHRVQLELLSNANWFFATYLLYRIYDKNAQVLKDNASVFGQYNGIIDRISNVEDLNRRIDVGDSLDGVNKYKVAVEIMARVLFRHKDSIETFLDVLAICLENKDDEAELTRMAQMSEDEFKAVLSLKQVGLLYQQAIEYLADYDELSDEQSADLKRKMIEQHEAGDLMNFNKGIKFAVDNGWDDNGLGDYITASAKTSNKIDNIKVNKEKHNWIVRHLDVGDYKALYVGDLTGCCQHLGGAGHSCALQSFEEDWANVVVVENKTTGEMYAQAFVWIAEDGKSLVIDSIESLFEVENEPVAQIIYKAYLAWAKKAVKNGYKVYFSTDDMMTGHVTECLKDNDKVSMQREETPCCMGELDYTDTSDESYRFKIKKKK